jgi:hypothetical protein
MTTVQADEGDLFRQADAVDGRTMIVFDSPGIALRYIAHRARTGCVGVVVLVEDTRTRSGLSVLWRDPVPADQVEVRMANCRWLLEEVLAGRQPRPTPGSDQ